MQAVKGLSAYQMSYAKTIAGILFKSTTGVVLKVVLGAEKLRENIKNSYIC